MKKYVNVIAKYLEDGKIKPLAIDFEGKLFDIDKIIDVRNCASLKSGGIGKRYTIKIKEQERYLFLEDNTNKWFIE